MSSAAKNRYLFHFNSVNSMTQWAAAIRLALYEHSSLLEAYTGCIIAGKGKSLNNIRDIMERSRSKFEDWVRVRFGAGTPWRRCWCVVYPPDPKQYQKMRKSMKKRSAYDRTTPLVTGSVKFYENKKARKAKKPIATISSAFAAYAIYPQSKELIDQSTLVKIEGDITTHGETETTAEGMVFVMPEIHPAVSGFEMMLRFLFPVFDTFGLYGRPNRLIADTNNVKSLMFALPLQKREGYLDVLDVANLIHTPGARDWDEKTWRKELKETTASRMATPDSPASSGDRDRQRQGRKARARFEEPGQRFSAAFNQSADTVVENAALARAASPGRSHSGMPSEPDSASGRAGDRPSTSQFSMGDTAADSQPSPLPAPERPTTRESSGGSSYGSGFRHSMAANAEVVGRDLRPNAPPTPVATPPEFAHSPRDTPAIRPQPSPELRMANHRMSMGTLLQLEEVGRMGRGDSVSEQQRLDELALSDQQRPQTGASGNYIPYRPDADERRSSIPSVGPPTPKRNSQAAPNLHIDTSKATKRKPVPSQDFQAPAPSQQAEEPQPVPPAEPSAPTPESEPPSSTVSDSSIAYLRQTVDEATLARIMVRQPSFERRPSPISPPPPPKPTQQVDDESVYSKDPEPESPDYSSSRPSVETERSEESLPRPRMGVLKTVGDAPPPGREVILGDTRYVAHDELPKENPDIPEIDFGPTMSYDPTTRRPSLGDINRISHQRSDSQSTVRQERRHRRGSSREEQRRSMLWQPGLAMGRPESPANRAVSPEEFVHRRSNSQQMPVIPPPHHRRTSSNSTVRPKSGDWAQIAHQYARDLPPRPHSRGAASVLGQQDLASHLSAREQEHVARITGSSFFNLSSSNTKQQPVGSGGLVAAIDARERERRDFREGVSNQMVQQAIAQRQQHQQAAAMYEGYTHTHSRSQSGIPAPRPQSAFYSMPGASYTWDTVSNLNAYRPTTMAGPPPGWGGHATPPAAQQSPHYYQYPHQIN